MLSTLLELIGLVGLFVCLVLVVGWLWAGVVFFAGVAVLGYAMGEQ